MADAIGTTVGACLGTCTTTTYVESAAGVAAGGRSGLTAFFVAVFFGIAIFFSPFFLSIPAAATAPTLIIVGLLMMEPILRTMAKPTGIKNTLQDDAVKEEDIDVSVKRLLKARFELGEMDDLEDVSWSKIPYSVVASAKHDSLALDMAHIQKRLSATEPILLCMKASSRLLL